MSLFRRHKDKKAFEEQLEQQLGDMEYKPSESLWGRINSGISSDGFEPSVRSKLDQFEQIPNPETWNKIESSLPTEKVPLRRFALFSMALIALMFSVATGYFMNRTSEPDSSTVLDKPVKMESVESSSVEHIKELKKTSQKEVGNSAHDQKTSSIKMSDEKIVDEQVDHENITPQATRPAQSNLIVSSAHLQSSTASTSKVKSQSNNRMSVHPAVLAIASVPQTSSEKPTIDERKESKPTTGASAAVILSDTPTTATASAPQKVDSNTAITGREITAGVLAQQDSIPTTASSHHQDENPDELTRFSISVFGGASLSGTTYSSPKNSTLNFEENISLRKQIERPSVDWSGGFMLDFRLNDRWMISSGIMMVNFNQEFRYDVDSAVKPANPADVGAPVVNPKDSFLVGNTYSNRIRYTWTEIPLFINYTLHRGLRWDVDLQGGVGYAFISTIDGGMVSYDNKGVLVLKDKESFPQISNTVYVSFLPQVSCKFAQGVSVGIVPSFKYSVTSIIGNESWIQQHPYFVGLSACLRKRF